MPSPLFGILGPDRYEDRESGLSKAMSAIFQRPVCDMGAAFDFAFRPVIGEPAPGSGGPCDDLPRRVEIFAAFAEVGSPSAPWKAFSLCPEHEQQLRQHDERLRATGRASRFRPGPVSATGGPR